MNQAEISGGVVAYVGLGSNLGDPATQVRSGMTALQRLRRTGVEACSSLYASAPVGMTQQPDFVNAVCRLRTALAAEALMQQLLAIEHAHGRLRHDDNGGPRTLDLDLLLYGEQMLQRPELTVPHPRLHQRAFVLYPLHELDPELVIPGRGRVTDLLAPCARQTVRKIGL